MMIDKYLRNKTRQKGSREAEGKKGEGRGIEMCILLQCTSKTQKGLSEI